MMHARGNFELSIKEVPVMKLTAFPILLTAVSALSASARAQAAWPYVPAVQVASAVTGAKVAEAFVQVSCGAATTSVITAADGWATLPNLLIPEPAGPDPAPTFVTIDVARAGYLPFKKRVEVGAENSLLSCGIVPTEVGFSTPLVRANRGGRFHLEGLGTLRVAPNALTQDVVLRLTPIPEAAWTNTLPVAEVLRYQIWLSAYDNAGQSANAALPAAPGMITLEVDVPGAIVRPEGMTLETWTTHCVGESFSYDFTCVAQLVRQGSDRVLMALGAGHNLIYQTFKYPDPVCNGDWGPWTYSVVFMKIRSRIISTAPVLCGVLTAAGESSVKAGEEVSSTLTWTEEDHRKYGLTGATCVGRVNVEVGFSSKYSEEKKEVVTTAREGKVSKADGSTISGRPAGAQGQGYDCLTGDAHFGEVYKQYAVFANRRKVCANGTIERESVKVAEVEVFVGVQNWYSVQWNPACPGCAPTGTVPPVPMPR